MNPQNPKAMITTSPTPTHRKEPKTAAHTAAQRRKQKQNERRSAAVERAWNEAIRTRGMKRSLRIFQQEPAHLIDGTYIIGAIDMTTGEIRKYWTLYPDNIKYIGNTDYMAYGRTRTQYMVYQWDDVRKEYHHITTRTTRNTN